MTIATLRSTGIPVTSRYALRPAPEWLLAGIGRLFIFVLINIFQEITSMKKPGISLLLALMMNAGVVQADTVTGEAADTTPGKGFGGLSGFMIGAAAGGPIGALLGTGIGWFGGGLAQEASGLNGTAYRVKRDDGSETTVRSPKRSWSPGDRVRIVDNRLVADTTPLLTGELSSDTR